MLKVLVELRPALDGYSGIPQETRLLFSGLGTLADTEVYGLIQSANLVVDPGIPTKDGLVIGGLSSAAATDCLARVVISLQQTHSSSRLARIRKRLLRYFGPSSGAVLALFGGHIKLGAFDPTHFKDFVWRSMFAKSLPGEDIDRVTSCAFRILRWPWSIMHAVGFFTAVFGRALYARLDTSGIDVMIVETPFPGQLKRPTRMIVRYHDAIPLLMPHTTKGRDYHRAAHYNALRRNAKDGAWFACVSESTRQDLLSVMPSLSSRAVTIPNMIPAHFFLEESAASRVPEIIWSRKNRRLSEQSDSTVLIHDNRDVPLSYLLMVGTLEPRKNHLALLDAWERLRAHGFEDLNLVFVGSLGWEHESILQRLSPWLRRGGLHLLEGVPAQDLRLLYRHARATVCPSFGEGFDFPGIEAMRCGGLVAASDIPVHRGVFGKACEYFSPYSSEALETCLRSLLAPQAQPRRDELARIGVEVAAQYLPERILPQWRELLQTVAS